MKSKFNTIFEPMTSQIESLVEEIPGWTPIDQLMALYTLAFSSVGIEGDILELGSWCGRSSVILGMAAKQTGNTKVYSVDLFPEKNDWFMNADGTYSFSVEIDGQKVNAYHEQTVWQEPYQNEILPVYEKHTSVWNAFQSSIKSNELDDIVLPFKGNLQVFETNVPIGLKLRLAFIDGDHGYEAVINDITIIEKYLVSGGWICFDDAFSGYDGVNRAIAEKIMESGNYADFQLLTRKFFVARKK